MKRQNSKCQGSRVKKISFFLLLATCYLVLLLGFSAIADIGTTIDVSRTIYTGRTLGMGGAHLGFSNDGEGIFTNPSGLSKLEFPQLVGLSRKLFLEETQYSIYGWAVPTQWGTFGLGYVDTSVGGSYATARDPSTSRIVINPSLEAVSYENSVLLLTAARDLPWVKNLSLGGNIKFFNQSLSGGGTFARGTGMNLDLSGSYKPFPYLLVAANLQNILGGTVNWNNTQDKLGGYTKLGAGFNLLGPATPEAFLKHDQKVALAFDIDLPREVLDSNSLLMHLGAEWTPLPYIALRAGINQEGGGTGLTFGAGFKQSAFRFDYAYAPRPGIAGDTPHYFSLSYVGDRVVTVDKKLNRKESGVKFLKPKDRFITSAEVIPIICEAQAKLVLDKKTTWTVPGIEATFEVKPAYEYENLKEVKKNDQPLNQEGTIETTEGLKMGRNIIKISGLTVPEKTELYGELKILKIMPFTDATLEYWAIEPISLSSVLGLIKGYPDNTFRPEKGITRAELTALLMRTKTLDTEKWTRAVNEQKFTDVEPGKWYTPYINLGVELGLVTGYPDQTFGPNKVLSRAEGVTILARYSKLPEKEGIAFSDLKSGFWANKFIQPAKEAGLLKYLEGQNFEPSKPLSRAEAAEVLYRTPPVQQKVNNFWEYGNPEMGTPEAR